jgi:hypothetical protein
MSSILVRFVRISYIHFFTRVLYEWVPESFILVHFLRWRYIHIFYTSFVRMSTWEFYIGTFFTLKIHTYFLHEFCTNEYSRVLYWYNLYVEDTYTFSTRVMYQWVLKSFILVQFVRLRYIHIFYTGFVRMSTREFYIGTICTLKIHTHDLRNILVLSSVLFCYQYKVNLILII